MKLGAITPILRIFDEDKAREFYVGFLGFQVDWEHRFDDNTPLYQQVSRDGCVLHLSGHFGDGCPGSAIRIETTGVAELQAALIAKQYKHARPGLEKTEWGTLEVRVSDPFGNRLTFSEPAPKE